MSETRAALLPENPIADIALAIEDPEQFASLITECEKSLRASGRDHVSSKMVGLQILLSLMGVLAVIVYLDPAKQCAIEKCDDAWLAKIIPNYMVRSYIYFLSGSVGYGSTDCTFAYYGPQEFKEMLLNLKTIPKKIAATASVSALICLQGMQIILTAKETGTSGLDLSLSVVGAVAGAVYGAVGITNKLKNVPQLLKNTAQYIYQHCKEKTLDERLGLASVKYYAQARKQFNLSIKAKWKNIITQASTIEIDVDQPPLEFLLSQDVTPKPVSWVKWGAKKAAQVSGTVLASALSSTFVNLVRQGLASSIDNEIGLALSTCALSATAIYANFALINSAANTAYDVVEAKVNGEAINSLIFQLRPIQTGAIVATSAAFALFSYAFADLGWEMMWPSAQGYQWDISLQAAGRAMARTGMAVFHFMGPSEVLPQLLFRRLLTHGQPREVYLAKLELTVDYLTTKMGQDEFIQHIENALSPIELALLSLQPWKQFVEKINALPEQDAQNEIRKYHLVDFQDDILTRSRPSIVSKHFQAGHTIFKAVPNTESQQDDEEKKCDISDMPVASEGLHLSR